MYVTTHGGPSEDTVGRRAQGAVMSDQLHLFRSNDPRALNTLVVEDPLVLVLADGRTEADANRQRGALFEEFIGLLLHRLGYETGERTLNVKQDGIELDIATHHRLTGAPVMVECKAHSSPLAANTLTSFYGKLVASRIKDSRTFGFFIALPRLTAEGQNFAKSIEGDAAFRVMDARSIVTEMEKEQIVVREPTSPLILSDRAVVLTAHGVFCCAKELDAKSRIARVVRVWSANSSVPDPVVKLIVTSSYANGLHAATFDAGLHVAELSPTQAAREPMIFPVVGGTSDFEYQLPTSPRYFVGRQDALRVLERHLSEAEQGTSLVLNAQSGWGKSSLALKMAALVEARDGVAQVVDTRNAASPSFVWTTLRKAAIECETAGLLRLPASSSYASLGSCLRTFAAATWEPDRPLFIVFDQFENVFRDPQLTAEFRDLALGVRELRSKIVIGFAWKTDLVGWTEEYPYQLRDDIRGAALLFSLAPFGSRDLGTLVSRLEKSASQKLSPELQERLREYSGGLPWLFKKLASHMLQQLSIGVSQERLASEALNAQALFEKDLAELSMPERAALHAIARLAPVLFDDVRDSLPTPIIQSLLNRRLIVQVGERLDTYWDVFRDFLNTGRVPIEDSYILRQTPKAVSRLISAALERNGAMTVADAAAVLKTSDSGVFNLSRDLRLLGVLTYAPGEIRVADEVMNAAEVDVEDVLRAIVTRSTKRHRAFRLLSELVEAREGEVSVGEFAAALSDAFPAVEVRENTWTMYARAFVGWFEYSRLASFARDGVIRVPASSDTQLSLLTPTRRARPDSAFPAGAPGPAIALLRRIRDSSTAPHGTPGGVRRAVRDLELLGVLAEREGNVKLLDESLVDKKGVVIQERLLAVIESAPGCRDALDALRADAACSPATIGGLIAKATGAEWSHSTKVGVGKHFRAWARCAGVETTSKRLKGPP